MLPALYLSMRLMLWPAAVVQVWEAAMMSANRHQGKQKLFVWIVRYKCVELLYFISNSKEDCKMGWKDKIKILYIGISSNK